MALSRRGRQRSGPLPPLPLDCGRERRHRWCRLTHGRGTACGRFRCDRRGRDTSCGATRADASGARRLPPHRGGPGPAGCLDPARPPASRSASGDRDKGGPGPAVGAPPGQGRTPGGAGRGAPFHERGGAIVLRSADGAGPFRHRRRDARGPHRGMAGRAPAGRPLARRSAGRLDATSTNSPRPTASSWTSSPKRSSRASIRKFATSCCGRRCWTG